MTWAPCPHGVRTRGKKKGCPDGLWRGHGWFLRSRAQFWEGGRKPRGSRFQHVPMSIQDEHARKLNMIEPPKHTGTVLNRVISLLKGVALAFFSTSADAMWAECPGHH